jgi:hypothetical protein
MGMAEQLFLKMRVRCAGGQRVRRKYGDAGGERAGERKKQIPHPAKGAGIRDDNSAVAMIASYS